LFLEALTPVNNGNEKTKTQRMRHHCSQSALQPATVMSRKKSYTSVFESGQNEAEHSDPDTQVDFIRTASSYTVHIQL